MVDQIQEPRQEFRPTITYNESTHTQVVKVPFWQTVVYSGFVGFAAMVVVGFLWWAGRTVATKTGLLDPAWFGWEWLGLGIFAALIGFAVMALVQWPTRMNEMMWWLEDLTGRDITHDNQIGRPTDVTMHAHVEDERGNSIYADVRHAQQLLKVVAAWKKNPQMKFTYREIRPLGVSDTDWIDIVEDLKRMGIMESEHPNNPHSTVILTYRGIQWMGQAAEQSLALNVQVNGIKTNLDHYIPIPSNLTDMQMNAFETPAPLWDFDKTQPVNIRDNRRQHL